MIVFPFPAILVYWVILSSQDPVVILSHWQFAARLPRVCWILWAASYVFQKRWVVAMAKLAIFHCQNLVFCSRLNRNLCWKLSCPWSSFLLSLKWYGTSCLKTVIYTPLAPWFPVMVTIKCLNALFSRCFDNHPHSTMKISADWPPFLEPHLYSFWSSIPTTTMKDSYPLVFFVTPKFGGFLVCWENKTTLPGKHLFVASSFNYSTQLGPTLMQIYGKFEGFPLVLRVKFGLVSFNTVETVDGRNPNQPPGM